MTKKPILIDGLAPFSKSLIELLIKEKGDIQRSNQEYKEKRNLNTLRLIKRFEQGKIR